MAERRQLAPGVYAGPDGMEVDLEEFVVAAGGDPTSPADMGAALRGIAAAARSHGIPLEIDPLDSRN